MGNKREREIPTHSCRLMRLGGGWTEEQKYVVLRYEYGK